MNASVKLRTLLHRRNHRHGAQLRQLHEAGIALAVRSQQRLANTYEAPLYLAFVFFFAFVFAFALLVAIPEEPALSEVEWGICCSLPSPKPFD
jgi:hypothetical protein